MSNKNKASQDNVINLDSARAARREAKGGEIKMIFGGEEFTFPPEIPFEVAEHLTAIAAASATDKEEEQDTSAVVSAMVGFLQALMGPEQWEGFRKHRPSFDDLQVLIDGAMKAYGFDSVGEQPASAE